MRRSRWPKNPRQLQWFIDGHNVIFADPTLAALQTSEDQAEARRLLEAMLDRLSATLGLRIMVVYDGSRSEPSPADRSHRRVSSIFSRPPDLNADDTIVRLVDDSTRAGEKVAVVTSDRALGRRLPAGVICLEPPELFMKLRERVDQGEPDLPSGDFSDIEEHFLGLDKQDRADIDEKPQTPPSGPDRDRDIIERKKARGLRKQQRLLNQPPRKQGRRRR